MTVVITDKKIPNKVFIVPYRNREEQKFFFSKYMSYIMEDFTDYEIYFSHQTDSRSFNRGATKNIGFLAIKNKYPDDYKNITFIFNDVDTIPFTKIFNYETTSGVVKHYYGFKYTLGGIIVMKGEDFEKINGFPNYWGWGSEDSCLQKRCEKYNIEIDRSTFFHIGSHQILHLFDGISRIINKKDALREKNDNGVDGINTIYKLHYEISEKSSNPKDNLYNVENPNIFIININNFITAFDYNNDSKELYNYDLREPKNNILEPSLNRKCDVNNIVESSDSWTNIPYYPTSKERKEMIANGIRPPNPYEYPENNFNLNDVPADEFYEKKNSLQHQQQIQQRVQRIQQRVQQQHQHQQQHQQHQQQHQQHQQRQMRPPMNSSQINIYSPHYANYMGIKPPATTSANVKFNGFMRGFRKM